jgi:hypothetical protein
MAEDDSEHQFTRKNNEATYAFFQKFLDMPGDPTEEELPFLTREELTVTSTGYVSTALGGETVFSLNKKESGRLIINLEESRKNVNEHLARVRQKAMELSGYQAPFTATGISFCGRYPRNGYSIEKFVLTGEGNYPIPLLVFVPEGGKKYPAIIYLHPDGKNAQSSVGGEIETLVRDGFIVAAPDLLGMGETKNSFRTDRPLKHDYVAMLIGRSLVGIQAGDLVRTVQYLISRTDVDQDRIAAVSKDEMGPVLLHAASFNESIHQVVLLGSPLSYKSIVMNKFYEVPFSCTVPGALTAYDLPDLIACIAPGKVVLSAPADHMLHAASPELIAEELEFPLKVYQEKKMPLNLKVRPATEKLSDLLKD